MNDKTREDFEAWAMANHPELMMQFAHNRPSPSYFNHLLTWTAATQQSAARIAALEAERADFRDASKVNHENYEFQRRKADAATATVYQFHYAMKDAGWHPGRTDDNLCDIIRAKGAELARLEAEVLVLRKDAAKASDLQSLIDWMVPNHDLVYHAIGATGAGFVERVREYIAHDAVRSAIEAERGGA